MQNDRKTVYKTALVAMLASSLLCASSFLLLSLGFGRGVTAQESRPANGTVDPRHFQYAQSLSAAFRAVAESLRPSVVSISTKTEIAARPRGLPPGFEDLFGLGPEAPRSRETTGMGSGVIVRSDGYILTNNHVVEDATELVVEMFDGRKVKGSIVGTDPETDLAVVKVELKGLRAAKFGSSEEIQVGDWVLAIGSPFGLDQTVTAGIISGKHRVQGIIDGGEGFEDFLQTDAAINPGNSGGPLVNLRGELVGINTAILSKTGASAGIGFAIPESLAQPVLRAIIESGEVRRGFIGASVVDVTPALVEQYDLAVRSGALIGRVLEGLPAEKAGLEAGDVVTTLDGRPCTGGTQFRNYVSSRPPGTAVRMQVNREGRSLAFTVNLKERTDQLMAMFDEKGGLFGAKLIPVTPESAREYGYRGLQNGLIVTEVEDGSGAAQADLQAGDVIESAAGIPLKSVKQLATIFTEVKRHGEPLRCVVRRGRQQFLMIVR